jgi:hypothetical protein
MTMTTTNLVAIDSNLSTAGGLVYWQLHGGVLHASLCAAWREAGLEDAWLPAPVTAETALRRALDELADRRTLVRPLEGRGSWAVVQEHVVDGELAHGTVLRAKLAVGGLDLRGADELAERVRVAYAAHRAELSAADISLWLTRVMARLDAVTLRDRGGVYFVPADRVEVLRRVVGALREVSESVVYQIPAVRCDQAADAVLAAVEGEARAEIASIESYLAEDTEHGQRALKTRVETIGQVREKVARYEELFDRRLDSVRAGLAELRLRVAGLLVTAGAAAEGREGERVLELDDRPAPAAPSPELDTGVRMLELD